MQDKPVKTSLESMKRWLESLPDAVLISDRDGIISDVNSSALKIFGYTRDDLIGSPVEILVPEDLRRVHRQHREGYALDPTVRPMNSDLQFSARRKDGSLFAAEISLGPVETAEGVLFVSAVRDITERNRIIRKLETNNLIQSTVASILRISLETGSLGDILDRILDELVSVSPIALRPMGAIFLVEGENPGRLRLAADLGLSTSQRHCCSDSGQDDCLCGRAVDTGRIVYSPGQYCAPILSGGCALGAINLYVEDGHESREEEENFLLAIADVLAGVIERKNAEEKLLQSEERFELAVKGTDAGIWDWDLRTNKVYFSPRWKSMLGFGESEINHDFAEWRERLHPDDLEHALYTIQEYFDGRSPDYELEHRLLHKDGTYRWIPARGASVFDSTGKPYRMVGSHIDITDHKRAEANLREREAQLLAAQWIQKQFLPERPPVLRGYDIAGSIHPADFAAGDLFDYIPLPDGSIALVIGDVAGHGIGSALVMASTHAYLHSFAAVEDGVGRILARTNAALCRETDPDMFVTIFLGRLQPETRSFTYASAGHPAGFILDDSGRVKRRLERTSMPLAITENYEQSESEQVALEPGDLLLLLTDGVLEARSISGELFGVEKALQVADSNRHLESSRIVDALYNEVSEFTGAPHPCDDVTIMVLKVEH